MAFRCDKQASLFDHVLYVTRRYIQHAAAQLTLGITDWVIEVYVSMVYQIIEQPAAAGFAWARTARPVVARIQTNFQPIAMVASPTRGSSGESLEQSHGPRRVAVE